MATHTNRKNHIGQLTLQDGSYLTQHREKTEALCQSFKTRLGTSDFVQIHYDLPDLIQIVALLVLDNPFSYEEIKLALNDMPIDHALGLDGFNGLFMKKCWDILQLDFSRLFS
jgi:hypothetical protein